MRLLQQELLAQLGVMALQGTPFETLVGETARLTARGLACEFCKVLELLPAENRLVVRAGVGWDPGVIGKATVGADRDSPAGYALRTGSPVISNHLENEQRFRTPELLVQHGIRRAANVVLQGEGKPYGVLEVDSREPGEFSSDDLSYLQGAANILGMAIERQRRERELESAVRMQDVLLSEMNHRVRNSLQLVSGMLRLQAATLEGDEVRLHLASASARISAVAHAHALLERRNDKLLINLRGYLADLCGALEQQGIQCSFEMMSPVEIELPADQAIPIALVVAELVANAAKHGYRDAAAGRVHVAVVHRGQPAELVVTVADEGAGLPDGFEFGATPGLGTRIVRSLAEQLGGTIKVMRRHRGAEFVLRMPLRVPSQG